LVPEQDWHVITKQSKIIERGYGEPFPDGKGPRRRAWKTKGRNAFPRKKPARRASVKAPALRKKR